MARLSGEDKELILADFHTGAFTNRELAKKYGVSHVTIGKITKGLLPKHKDKVTTQIAIKTELSEESYHEVTAVERVVTEKTKHLLFFKNSALKNQKLANDKLDDIEDIRDLEAHARLTSKNKETVLGKDIETQINIQNSNEQTNNSIQIEWE